MRRRGCGISGSKQKEKSMRRFRLAKKVCMLSLVAATLFAFGLPPSALANVSATFTLNVGNPNLASQGSGAYGTVTVTGTGAGTTATSWTVTAQGLNGFVFGGAQIINLNFSGSPGTINGVIPTSGTAGAVPIIATALSCTDAAGNLRTCGTFSTNGSNNADGFGSFSLSIDNGSGFSAPYSSFTLTFTTGNSVSLAANGSGATVAAHMARASTASQCTGYAANAGTSSGETVSSGCSSTSIPEPNSLVLLLASGIVGALAVFVRRVIV